MVDAWQRWVTRNVACVGRHDHRARRYFSVHVIPAPAIVRPAGGPPVVLRSGSAIGWSEPRLGDVMETFRRDVRRVAALDLRPTDAPVAPEVEVRFGIDVAGRRPPLPATAGVDPSPVPSPEWYRLDVGASGVSVAAGSVTGVARAAATLVQLIATSPSSAEGTRVIAPMHIADAPAFAWRGLTLDVARRFFEVAELVRIIDLLALYRLNVLHLHLTDDEGWRVQAGRVRRPHPTMGTTGTTSTSTCGRSTDTPPAGS